jgi:hypothetical protein
LGAVETHQKSKAGGKGGIFGDWSFDGIKIYLAVRLNWMLNQKLLSCELLSTQAACI